MTTEITVPRLGWSMEEGTFAEWLKQDGEYVRRGDMLFVLEGDKAAQEIESFDEGVLVLSPEGPRPGDTVRVGQVLAWLATREEYARLRAGAVSGPAENASAAMAVATAPAAAPGPPAGPSPESATPDVTVADESADRVAAGPAVRRLARELQVDLAGVTGTRPGQRITEDDVRRAASEPRTTTAAERRSRPSRQCVTPRARRRAMQDGVELSGLSGTGCGGRIRERDVAAAASLGRKSGASTGSAAQASARGVRQAHTTRRRIIAERMVASHLTTAPVTLTTTADVTNLVNLRDQFRHAAKSDAPIPGYTDLIVRLTAVALQAHPKMNSRWEDDALVVCETIDIGIAVDTPAGLVVPVLRGVEQLSLRAVCVETARLAELARAGRLTVADMQDGTFTVTNLGAHGIDAFTPIINGAQCGILGIGRIRRQPVVRDQQIVARDQVVLSLTFDHRIVDGVPAADFLATLVSAVENPAQCLISLDSR